MALFIFLCKIKRVKKFVYLQHTADAKFQAFGTSLEECFRNAALATASLMWDAQKIEKKISHPFNIEGRDLKQVLSKFLEEMLYLLDSRMFLLHSVEEIKIKNEKDQYFLSAVFWGDSHSDRYQIFGDVKAITYNEMRIEGNDHFMVQVVVDT
jgi:SHS2 domain-containing protein